jgi:splicing factor 3A subunit 1
MAPSAVHGDAIAVLEEIKAPPGVVLPPKEIKGAPMRCPTFNAYN